MYSICERTFRDELFAFETDRLRLAVLKKSAVDKVTDYYVRNRQFHRQWSQTHNDDYFTKKEQKAYLKSDEICFFDEMIIPLYIVEKTNPNKIIGRVSLFNVSRGGMQSAIIGYHLDEHAQGKGFMLEAVKATCEVAFDYFRLHRIEAYIMPHNQKSLNLIRNAGFEEDGYKRKFMHINGEWEDHVSFSYLNEK